MEKELTEKQKRFIDYYIETGNQTEAARLAGYKQPHVQGNRQLENVREKIQEKMQAKEDERIASQDEVLRFLSSIVRNEELEEVALLCGDGCQELVKKGISAKDRIKAAELLGKRYGLDRPEDARPDSVEIILRREE